MVTVIRDPLSGKDFAVRETSRMYIYSETGNITFSLPVAPREIQYGNFGNDWVEADRSGNTPLLLRKGSKLETLAFSALLTAKDSMFFSQSDRINVIRALANTAERVLIRYGAQEAGLWRVTESSYNSELRHPDTNEITRGTVSMSFKRASDPAPAVGPVTGGPRPAESGNATPPPQRTYTVVKGDCLWRIAQKFYSNGTLWPRIYDANRDKIKNPNLIYPGQVFVIP